MSFIAQFTFLTFKLSNKAVGMSLSVPCYDGEIPFLKLFWRRFFIIIWFCSLFLFSCSGSAIFASSSQSSPFLDSESEEIGDRVEVGKLFSVQRKVDIPDAAMPTLRLYLKTLFFSRPLPWPYQIENFSVKNGTITLQGRLLRPGTYDIPLGVLWWQGRPYLLPSLSCEGVPISLSPLTPSSLLLPFPQKALVISSSNMHVQEELLATNQEAGMMVVRWQEFWRHAIAVAGLLFVCIPLGLQCRRWWKVQHKKEEPLAIVTPASVFREVKELQKQGQKAWPKLLYVLNLVGSEKMPSLTSYELEKRFTASGDKRLADASRIIEEYAYIPDGDKYFASTVELIEQELLAKKLFT